MPIQITCPSCGRPLRMKEELAGTLVRCPGCAHEFIARADDVPETGIRPSPEPAAPRDPEGTYHVRPSEPPPVPRPTRPPRPDDYDDDDDDDVPRRRRRVDRQYAKDKVNGPANGLLAVGWIGVAMTVMLAALNIFGLFAGPGNAADAADAVGGLVGIPFQLAASVLVIVGATRMKNLENHGLAKAAAIIAIVPCTSPCCLLGIPFGIIALNALNDAEVSAAFRAGPRVERNFDD